MGRGIPAWEKYVQKLKMISQQEGNDVGTLGSSETLAQKYLRLVSSGESLTATL